MNKTYILRPTHWNKGRSEPNTISFELADGKAEKGSVRFIEGSIAARPCPEKSGIALKAFRGDGFSIMRRGAKEEEEVPNETIVMIFIGDKVTVSGNEYTFLIETVVTKKPKLDDDDDDDDFDSSSSFSSSSSSSLFSSSSRSLLGDDDDDDDVVLLSKEGEAIYNSLLEMYPDREKNELTAIAQNTASLFDATATIFDPTEAIETVPKQQQPSKKSPQKQSPPPPPPSSKLNLSRSTQGSGSGLLKSSEGRAMEEEKVDAEVMRLSEEFPYLTLDQVTTAYEASDREVGVARKYLSDLMATTIQQQPKKVVVGNAGPLGQLQEMFPNIAVNVLEETLRSCKDNLDTAVNRLLMMDDEGNYDAAPAPAPAPAPKPVFGKAPASVLATGYWNIRGTGQKTEELTKEMDARGMIVNVDMGLPWQSSHEMNSGYREYIYSHVWRIRDDREMQHTAVCLQTMIENEQRRYHDSYCFYHSFSVAHLMYELNSLIATIVYDLDTTEYDGEISRNLDFVFPPVPRVLFKPFTVIKDVNELSNFCKSMRTDENDGSPVYQAVGLSVSTSFFSMSSEAPPVALFRNGYSANFVKFDDSMRALLKECGFELNKANHIINVINSTAKRYNYPTGRGMSFIDERVWEDRATGHMLQIFINKAIVDQYVYPSKPYGFRKGKESMSSMMSANKTNGQARIYITPDLFRSHEYARLYYYCADMKFSTVREEFVRDVKRQLSDIFLNEETRKMIKYNIRGKYEISKSKKK